MHEVLSAISAHLMNMGIQPKVNYDQLSAMEPGKHYTLFIKRLDDPICYGIGEDINFEVTLKEMAPDDPAELEYCNEYGEEDDAPLDSELSPKEKKLFETFVEAVNAQLPGYIAESFKGKKDEIIDEVIAAATQTMKEKLKSSEEKISILEKTVIDLQKSIDKISQSQGAK